MSYEVFKRKVNAIIEKAGGNMNVSFSTNDGTHIARFSDGTTIKANVSCLRMSVRWGSGHTAIATV